MCMRLAHQLAGFATGAALAVHAGQPPWMAGVSGAAAVVTAGGRLSPDMDQFKGWRRVDRIIPGKGPMQHRGITHWWGLPALAGMALATAHAPWLVWMLLAGWASHLAADFVFGKADRWSHRGPGIPLFPWWGHVGVGLDAGGYLERYFLVPALTVVGPLIVIGPAFGPVTGTT